MTSSSTYALSSTSGVGSHGDARDITEETELCDPFCDALLPACQAKVGHKSCFVTPCYACSWNCGGNNTGSITSKLHRTSRSDTPPPRPRPYSWIVSQQSPVHKSLANRLSAGRVANAAAFDGGALVAPALVEWIWQAAASR